MTWDTLNPPYKTLVVDPPWHYDQGGPRNENGWASLSGKAIAVPPYPSMTIEEISDLKIGLLADADSHLYLWTTNAYLRASFDIIEAWGFRHSQTLTWCKTPRGLGPGGAFSNTTEFVLFCRHGSLKPLSRIDSTWFGFPRRAHSVKPMEFMDMVEKVSPGPYVEVFARVPRAGWDAWGNEVSELAYSVQQSMLE